MPSAASAFPYRPFNLRVEVWLISQDTNPAAPSSLVGWQLWIDKTSYSPTFSNDGIANRRIVLDGAERGSNYGRGFDFRAGGPWLILSGETRIAHNADGTKSFGTDGYADYAILGATSVGVVFYLPTIPTYGVPNPPINGVMTEITKTSMNYRFGNGGGTNIQRYETRYGVNSDMSGSTIVSGGDGLSPLTNLKPGTVYYAEARAINDRGPSAWGARASARTRSGAWISDGTQWLPADVFISDGTKWLPADVQISDGTSWKPTA